MLWSPGAGSRASEVSSLREKQTRQFLSVDVSVYGSSGKIFENTHQLCSSPGIKLISLILTFAALGAVSETKPMQLSTSHESQPGLSPAYLWFEVGFLRSSQHISRCNIQVHQCLSEGGTIPGLALPGTKQTNTHHERRLTLLTTAALLRMLLTGTGSLM